MLYSHDDNYLKQFKAAIRDVINRRMPAHGENKFYVMGTFLDPNYQPFLFNDDQKQFIKSDLIGFVQEDAVQVADFPQKRIHPVLKEKFSLSEKLKLQAVMEEPKQCTTASRISPIEKEINDYMDIGIEVSTDVWAYWREHRTKYHILSPAARKTFCMKATNTASERLNSAAGRVVSNRRERLSAEHIEQLVLLSHSAACDGNSYQIVPNEMSDMPLPAGVLPL